MYLDSMRWLETDGEIRYQVNPDDIFCNEYEQGSREVREVKDAGGIVYCRLAKLKGNNDLRIQSLIFSKAWWTQQKAKNWVEKNLEQIMTAEIAKGATIAKSYVDSDSIAFYKRANLEPQAILFKDATEDQTRDFIAAKKIDKAVLKKIGGNVHVIVRQESDFQKGSLRDIQMDGAVLTVGVLNKDVQKTEIQKKVPDRFSIPVTALNYLSELDITEATLTKSPAVGKMAEFLIVKSSDVIADLNCDKTVPIIKVDDERKQVGGYLLVPNLPDSQGDIVTAQEVEKACHRFMKNLAHGNQDGTGSGLEHKTFSGIGYPIESFIDREAIHGVKDGWFLTTQVVKDEVWQAVKKGEIVGYSVGGKGKRVKADISLDAIGKATESTLEEKGFLKKLYEFFAGGEVRTPQPIIKSVQGASQIVESAATPVTDQPQIEVITKQEKTIMELKLEQIYTAAEIAKAKEKGANLEKMTAQMYELQKAAGGAVDWRIIGFKVMSFLDAAKNGEFGSFPTEGVAKSADDQEMENLKTQMAAQQAKLDAITKSRGTRQSSPVVMDAAPTQDEPESRLNLINFTPTQAAQTLMDYGDLVAVKGLNYRPSTIKKTQNWLPHVSMSGNIGISTNARIQKALEGFVDVRKAEFDLTDLGNGGLLLRQQSDRFISMLRFRPTLLGLCRFVPAKGPSGRIDRIGFASRILHTATESTELSSGNKSVPTTTKVDYDCHAYKAHTFVSYEAMEDNIQGKAFDSFLMSHIAGACAVDIEEISLLSDTASGDPDLAVFDGLLKLAEAANVYDHNGAAVSKTAFKQTILSIPPQYRAKQNELCFLVPPDLGVEWQDEQADRVTVSGDQVLFGDMKVDQAYNIPLISCNNMPATGGVGSNEGKILLTHPKNVLIVVWREILMEWARDIKKGGYDIVTSIRFDAKFEQVEGAGVGKEILIA